MGRTSENKTASGNHQPHEQSANSTSPIQDQSATTQSLMQLQTMMASSPVTTAKQSMVQLISNGKTRQLTPTTQFVADSQQVIQRALIQIKDQIWEDERTGKQYEQITCRFGNKVRVRDVESGNEIDIVYADGKWHRAKVETNVQPTRTVNVAEINAWALDFGYRVGEFYAQGSEGVPAQINELAAQVFMHMVQRKPWLENRYDLFSQGFEEGYFDVYENMGWGEIESLSVDNNDIYGGEEETESTPVEHMDEENKSLFIPTISQDESNIHMDDDSEAQYDHSEWIRQQKLEHKQAALVAARNHVNVSSAELSTKSQTIFASVVNTGIYSDRAVYTPKKWVEKMLPQMNSEGRKLVAGDLFNTWMKNNSVDDDEVPRLNRKLQSLQVQFGLSSSHLVQDSTDQHMYAELKASPSIFVPVKTATISGSLTGKSSKTDKLDAVQYDGPELSPLGQFLKSINKNYANKDFDTAGTKFPQVYKTDTLLTNSNDNVTELSYRPGTVEAVSTQTRGKGRSGTGESKVGRMGVQEELINTGKLNDKQYEGGHLIGDQIMDPTQFDLYKPWNLAPQENEFNAPVYSSAMENGATKAVDGGAEVHVRAEVSYPSDTYEVPVLDVVDRVMDGKNKKVGTSTTTWYDAVAFIQNKTKSVLDKFKFMTRIPGYWHAHAKDVKKKGKISGSITNRDQGVQVLTGITAGSIYNPTGTERFRFSVFTDGDSSTGTALPLPVKPKSKPQSKYAKANSVYIYARQKTHLTGIGVNPNNMRTMSVTQINTIVNNSARANAIKSWLVANPAAHTITDLDNVKGVGKVTLKKIIAAGWTI